MAQAVKPLPPGRHLDLLQRAVAVEAAAQRALLAGDDGAARDAFGRAAWLYRLSWRVAPPRSYGRLIGMVKAAVLAGGGEDEARYALASAGRVCDSPAAAYLTAMCALVLDDDSLAGDCAAVMTMADGAFRRAGAAIAAIAGGDAQAYTDAATAIVASFETRDEHLTGVPIADTALMLARIAARRGIDAPLPASPVLPPSAA